MVCNRVELEEVVQRLGYSLDRKPQFQMLDEAEGEPIVAPVPAIAAVAGAHAASRVRSLRQVELYSNNT